MTHLILHKVRGEPAFDIAEQLENGWWILATGGWRVYPYIFWPLTARLDLGPSSDPADMIAGKEDWASWPDCFASALTAAPKRGNVEPMTLEDLGL